MLSPDAQKLIVFLSKKDEEQKKENLKPKINLKTTVGMFAFIFEKARNFVDYQEEHLLLRRAITRILIRRIKTETQAKKLAETLVAELLMARYFRSGELTEDKLFQIERILSKYLLLYQNLGKRKLEKGENFLDFWLSLSAREIEEAITVSNDDQLLTFSLNTLEKRIIWEDQTEDEEKRARLLIGLMRTLSKYDDRTIYYKLWKIYFPKWTTAKDEEILEVAKNYSSADLAIRNYLSQESGEVLVRILTKYIAPYQILRDLVNQGSVENSQTFSSPENLEKTANAAVNLRYRRAISSLRQSAVNSFVYIFVTKMVLALAIEIPYELFIASKINYIPIIINLFFPPSLMLFMALTVESPKEKNTQKIVKEISSMIFEENALESIKINLFRKKSAVLNGIFRIVYVTTFLLTFGLTVYILRKLNFSIVSLGIFFFFLSTISFFAFRIRSSFKELVVGEEDSNLVSSIFDFFMLPFIKLGRIISSGLQDVNFFVFIFDIIIEAPFKLILEIIEQWISFLKEKKEEALSVIK